MRQIDLNQKHRSQSRKTNEQHVNYLENQVLMEMSRVMVWQ